MANGRALRHAHGQTPTLGDRSVSVAGGAILECLRRLRAVSETAVELMRQIDELYLNWPYYGSRRLSDELQQRGLG